MSTLRRIAIFYLAYLGLALLLITPALNFLPHRYLHDTYGRELQADWILLNPFTLSLDISKAQLHDAGGAPFVAFSEASINLSLKSLWQAGWVFDRVIVRDLELAITRLQGGKYNFSDLLASSTTPDTPDTADQAPGVTIHDLDLHWATLVLTDQDRATPFISRWNGLHVRATDLSTVIPEQRPFSMDVQAHGGGTLRWAGEVSLPQRSSVGSIALTGLNLPDVWVLAQPQIPFALRQGRLTVEGEYQLDWHDAFNYRISNGRIQLADLAIAPPVPEQLPDTTLTLKAADITNIALDSAARHVTIDSVALDGLAVAGWMEDSRISLRELLVPPSPVAAASTPQSSANALWSVAVKKAQLSNSSLHWRSPFTEPQVLEIQPVAAALEHITWPLSGDSRITLSLAVNQQAHLTASATMGLADGNGTIDATLDGLPLTWFSPNLPKPLKLTVTDGVVQVQAQVALQDYAPATIAGVGSVRDFSARRLDADTPLTSWDSVRFDGLAVDMQQHNLVLQKLSIDSYNGRLHIRKDGSINASNIWKEEVGEQAEEIAEQLTADKPWSFSLPTILINDSTIDFMDESLPIAFRTVIGDIEGDIRNITSTRGGAATVKLAGAVDGYAPVALTGKISPFAKPADLDLTLTFEGVDMALLSPYSAVYAGYAIEQGLLNLDLRYALQNNRLQGHNTIRIEKLKLGKKISSDKAIDIPLQIALALLTDANGVIDIAVPVSGDVDNPAFELGSVISKAFVNIIQKAITAPFTLLASLVSSESDLQRTTFAAGSAQLSAANKQKLTQLATALIQRPQLSLAITGRFNPGTDRARLQKNNLKAQLLQDGLTEQEIKARGPQWEEAIAALYAELPVGNTVTPAPDSNEQYAQLVQGIAVPDEQLRTLADDRAVAVKSYLLNEAGLAPDRAVVAKSSVDAAENVFSGVELGMGN